MYDMCQSYYDLRNSRNTEKINKSVRKPQRDKCSANDRVIWHGGKWWFMFKAVKLFCVQTSLHVYLFESVCVCVSAFRFRARVSYLLIVNLVKGCTVCIVAKYCTGWLSQQECTVTQAWLNIQASRWQTLLRKWRLCEFTDMLVLIALSFNSLLPSLLFNLLVNQLFLVIPGS